MFETRSDAWEAVGLSFEINERVLKRSRRHAAVFLLALIAAEVGAHMLLDASHLRTCAPRCAGHVSLMHRWGVASLETPVRIAFAVVVLALGWGLARALGHFIGPSFMRRMDPATAGTVGFLTRLLTMVIAIILALRVAGVSFQSLVVGGAFTAVVLGLAAQQTLGNVIAGMVLLSAQPFRVGERIRLQAGALGGVIEGVVSSLGLLYTTISRGADRYMIPNNGVLAAVVVPILEPASVDVRVRLSSGVRPTHVQAILDQDVVTPTRAGPSVHLEEIDGDNVVVRVQATPERSDDGAKLADEIMVALASVTGEHETVDDPAGLGGASPS